jgi:deoxyribonuclease V
MLWPDSFAELTREQERLAGAGPPLWRPPETSYPVAGCFVCFPRGRPGYGTKGDRGWAAAAVIEPDGEVVTTSVTGTAGARYEAGLLALREGVLLEEAVRGLPRFPPAALLVNATGRDHPRRAGLALHLGALLGLPTVGVTHGPLVATGSWPELVRGSRAALSLAGECVGYWLCTRDGARPLAIHAAWRTDPETAVDVVLAASNGRARTPEPLRQARRAARCARIAAERALPA